MSRIYYVSTKSGNDQNDGSISHPFLTLSAAANRNLEPGSEIWNRVIRFFWSGDPYFPDNTCI